MTRPEPELNRGASMSQRFSSGSDPLNADASTFHRPHVRPAVATPKVMCEESSQWWPMGASGSSIPENRCMNVGGPRAGSPGRPK